ncbi:MAG TPA: hypothetical protein VKH42_20875, partial [Vicinamibacterales bacterium]|nr:hypothetical protein [Vicinamibacterales bacterium]
IRNAGGARIDYWLKKAPQKMTLEILDAQGKVVRTFEGAAPNAGRGGRGRGDAEQAGQAGARGLQPSETAEAGRGQGGRGAEELPQEDEEGGGRGRGGPPTASNAVGLQRFAWDLQYQPVVTFPGMVLWGATQSGPTALPGPYQARLTIDGRSQTQPFAVKKHPFHTVSDADLAAQFDLASAIRDKVNEANDAIIQIRRIKREIDDRLKKTQNADVKAVAEQLMKELTAVEEDVYQVRNQSNQDPLNFPIKTNNRLASLLRVVEAGEGRPTGNVEPIFDDLKKELQAETDRLKKAVTTYLPRFNTLATRQGLDPISEK